MKTPCGSCGLYLVGGLIGCKFVHILRTIGRFLLTVVSLKSMKMDKSDFLFQSVSIIIADDVSN